MEDRNRKFEKNDIQHARARVRVRGVEIEVSSTGEKAPALHLAHLGIESLEEIEGLEDILALHQLDLAYNKIWRFPSDSGYESRLPCLRYVEWLDLSNNKLSKIDWFHLVRNVRVLLLHGNSDIQPDQLCEDVKALEHLIFLTYTRDGRTKARFFRTAIKSSERVPESGLNASISANDEWFNDI